MKNIYNIVTFPFYRLKQIFFLDARIYLLVVGSRYIYGTVSIQSVHVVYRVIG